MLGENLGPHRGNGNECALMPRGPELRADSHPLPGQAEISRRILAVLAVPLAEVVTRKGPGPPGSFKSLLRAEGVHSTFRGPSPRDRGCRRTRVRRHPCLLAPLSPLLLWPRGEQCGGCRRANTTDRPHAFQVILADRPCLELSADSEAEMAGWMQQLCQAVSKGVSASGLRRSSGLPTPSSPLRCPFPRPTRTHREAREDEDGDLQGTAQERVLGLRAACGPDAPTVTPVPTSTSDLGGARLTSGAGGAQGLAGPLEGAGLVPPTPGELQLASPLCRCPSGHPPGGGPQPLHPLLPGDYR